jgi:lysozyme family protein
MTAANFDTFLSIVWPDDGGYDSPKQGYHVTPGDAGGGTFGGVTEALWAHAVSYAFVTGDLRSATDEQLSKVIKIYCWDPEASALPSGLDVLVANGLMMSGHYSELIQRCLGFTGAAVDNDIGPDTKGALSQVHLPTFIRSLSGMHYSYLRNELPAGLWARFGDGWGARIVDVMGRALAMVV